MLFIFLLQERAASIASIHSAISAMSPITGNPFSVSIPTYLHRGSGLDVYYEYEVKVIFMWRNDNIFYIQILCKVYMMGSF